MCFSAECACVLCVECVVLCVWVCVCFWALGLFGGVFVYWFCGECGVFVVCVCVCVCVGVCGLVVLVCCVRVCSSVEKCFFLKETFLKEHSAVFI